MVALAKLKTDKNTSLEQAIESVLEKKSALGIKDLAVNGRDLMQEGIPSGKAMGMILNELFETVTESPTMNEKEKLLALAKNIFREKFRT